MKYNQALSWKFTLPLGVIIFLVGAIGGQITGSSVIGGTVGSSLCLIGFIMVVFGIVDYSKRKQKKES